MSSSSIKSGCLLNKKQTQNKQTKNKVALQPISSRKYPSPKDDMKCGIKLNMIFKTVDQGQVYEYKIYWIFHVIMS